jgi:predicted permease
MSHLLWRLVERRLERALPPQHLSSTIGDLAEDYAGRCADVGRIRAGLWLIRETWSLTSAHRTSLPRDRRSRSFAPSAELRYAVRRLGSRPLHSLACAALLGVAIGLCTAAFSVVDAVLIQPAPFRDADQLVQQTTGYAEPALMEAWRASGMFEDVEAARVVRLEAPASAAAWTAALVTPGVFDLLGVTPIRGRAFTTFGERAGPTDEVVISEAVWRSHFGSDIALLGRRIALQDGAAVVVGIMPASFRFPTPSTVFWRPFYPTPREAGGFLMFGRLKEGVPVQDAEGRTKAMALALARLPPNYSGPPLTQVGTPALDAHIGRALWLLLGGAGLVFVVLTANVSGLVMTGLAARRREFGMCAALGASRGRLLREAAIEHALIGVAGAGVGLWFAWSATALIPDVFQGHTLNLVDIDGRALLAASALGAAAVIVSGIVPAWLGTRPSATGALPTSRQAGVETPASRSLTTGLLVGEVALACALLAGSLLLVRSFANLARTDRGLNADGVVRLRVTNLDDAVGYGEPMRIAIASIAAQFGAAPNVSAVAVSREVPPGPTQRQGVHLGPPRSRPDPDRVVPADSYRVGGSFFELYAIPILRGRAVQPGDDPFDVVVSERLAERLWPGADPIGRTFAAGMLPEPRRVIGVAGELRLPTLDPALDRPEFYIGMGVESRTLYVSLRCRGSCPAEPLVQALARAVHPKLDAHVVSPAEDAFLSELRLPRAAAEVGGVFAVVAVVTASAGLFSLLTAAVHRRRHEFGVRVALGASPGQIHRLVVGTGLKIVGIGVSAGVLAGWMVGRSLAAFHYEVTSLDSTAWAVVVVTIGVTSLAAAWRPARQAARFNPLSLLREE